MSSVNKAMIIGNVGNINKAEFNQGQTQRRYMNITVATNQNIPIREPNTGNILRYEQKTVWHKVSAFDGMIDTIEKWGIKTGSLVRIEGRMEKNENRVTQEGVVHVYHDTTIIAEHVLNLSPKDTAN